MKGGRGAKENAPLDAGTSGEGQGTTTDIIVAQDDRPVKEEN